MKKLVGTVELNPYVSINDLEYTFTCPNCNQKYDFRVEHLYNGAFRLEMYEDIQDESNK